MARKPMVFWKSSYLRGTTMKQYWTRQAHAEAFVTIWTNSRTVHQVLFSLARAFPRKRHSTHGVLMVAYKLLKKGICLKQLRGENHYIKRARLKLQLAENRLSMLYEWSPERLRFLAYQSGFFMMN